MAGESLVLNQCGQYLSVSPEVIHQLGDLVGRCLVPENDSQHGSVIRKATRSLIRSDCGSRLPNAGLFSALQVRAQQIGVSLQRHITPAITSLPAPIRLKFLRWPQIAHFVFQASLGQIGIHPGICPEDVVVDLSLAFPDARIVVLGEHVPQLRRLRRALCARKIRAEGVTSRYPLLALGDSDEELPQVICSTPREAANFDFATASIVLLLDASACQHSSMQMTLSQIDAAFRLYGLVDMTRLAAPSSIDAMMATFGPHILRLHSEGKTRRDMHVAWVPTPPPAVNLKVTDPGFGLRCYWHHERRNRRIKQLAIALRSSMPLNRRTYGDVAHMFRESGYRAPSVTILVDRPLHAEELSRMLPDWPVITSDETLDGLGSAFCELVRQSRQRWLEGSHQIVVASAARQFRGDISDVVIWAGGGNAAAPLPRNWLGTGDTSCKPLLLIDFQDCHNEVAEQLSRQRQSEYLQEDMFSIGISTSQGRLVKFLSTQPRRAR